MNDLKKGFVLGLAALVMGACAPADGPSIDQALDHPLYPSVIPPVQTTGLQSPTRARVMSARQTHASIHNPSGERIWLAGKANLAATNAWLARRGERFVAANPDDMPNPYWGLDPTANAYIFLSVAQYPDSRWELEGVRRQGPYAVFDVTVYGFRTDATGARLDVTGDGVVDDSDWIGLELRTTLSGTSPGDTTILVRFEREVFGARADGGTASVGGVDADGYPNRARVGAPPCQIALEVGAGNGNRCAPERAEWERCWYWDDIVGTVLTAYPAPRSLVDAWSYTNNVPNWVKFDPAADTFRVADRELAAQLRAIDHAPLFWVRSNSWSASFDATP